LNKILDDNPDIVKNLLVIWPDTWALNRARKIADLLNASLWHYTKRRNLSVIENGCNPVTIHQYIGDENISGKNVIIPDDIIWTWGTMLRVAEEIKKKWAKEIILMSSHATFVRWIEEFDEAYKNWIINGVYISNLSYIQDEVKNKPWCHYIDCSNLVADIIWSLVSGKSISVFNSFWEVELIRKSKISLKS
jgi:ribose-phosphate pyrophosphokinase